VKIVNGIKLAGRGGPGRKLGLPVALAALAVTICISAWTGLSVSKAVLRTIASPNSTSFGSAAHGDAQSNPAVLLRGPYLQSVTTNGVVVVWETDVAGDSRVDYGLTAGYGSVVSDSTPITHHELALTGLGPYTAYHYRASTNGSPDAQDSVFRTAPTPQQPVFSFVAFGDTRSNATAHQAVVNSILSFNPSMVLHMGDFVENGLVPDQWTTFFTIEHDLLRQSPLFGVLGNHDRASPYYFEAFHFPGNERWYSFDYGNVHFVALQVDGNAAFNVGSEQATWLENDLAHTDQYWKVVFFHIPPYSSGAHGSKLDVRAALEPIFIRTGVNLVFNGHDHDYEHSAANGIVYVVTGGGGAPLSALSNPNPASIYFASTYHSVLVTVTQSLLSVTAIRSDGVPLDRFDVRKPFRYYLPFVLKR
jgi:predicted phosphodiesterase